MAASTGGRSFLLPDHAVDLMQAVLAFRSTNSTGRRDRLPAAWQRNGGADRRRVRENKFGVKEMIL